MASESIRRVEDAVVRIARLFTPVGVIAILWLNSQYVTRNEYALGAEKLSGRVQKIEEVLIRMESNALTDARHDREIGDHEERLRHLEKRMPN